MVEGVLGIIFDNAGQPFFLILQKETATKRVWEFCKDTLHEGESMKDALVRTVAEKAGLSRFHVLSELNEPVVVDNVTYAVFLINSSMNIPVAIKKPHVTYLWGTTERVLEKLPDIEKQLVEQVLEKVKAH